MSRKMQKTAAGTAVFTTRKRRGKMKKIIWNCLSVLYPKDIKEEREKVLSWYEVGRGKPPGEKVPKPGKPPKLILT